MIRKVRHAVYDLANGLHSGIPLCCTWFFVKRGWQVRLVGLSTDIERGLDPKERCGPGYVQCNSCYEHDRSVKIKRNGHILNWLFKKPTHLGTRKILKRKYSKRGVTYWLGEEDKNVMVPKLSYLKVIVNSRDEEREKEDLLKVLHNWCYIKADNNYSRNWPMFLFKQHNRDVYYCVALGPEATMDDIDTPHMNPDERWGLLDVGFDAVVQRVNDPEATQKYVECKAVLDKRAEEKFGK